MSDPDPAVEAARRAWANWSERFVDPEGDGESFQAGYMAAVRSRHSLDGREKMGDLSNHIINGEPQTWKQLYEREHEKCLKLEACRIMLADLGRNENGRHQGDGDVYDATGVSRGNPHLRVGDVIGYTLGGTWMYVVPEPHLRGDVDAWRVRA